MEAIGNLKICPTCRKQKHVDEFYQDSFRSDGLHRECKECVKERQRKRYVLKKMTFNKRETRTIFPQQGIKATLSLGDFEDSQLIAELRRRGYSGEIQFYKKIVI